MSINLAGYTLTDNANETDKWTFPSVTLNAGGYLVVNADDDAAPTTGNQLYTGFKLSAGGEYVGLYDTSGVVVSEFAVGGADYPEQFEDVSYGVRFDTGNFDQVSYFATPTPGGALSLLLGDAPSFQPPATPLISCHCAPENAVDTLDHPAHVSN